MTVDDGRSDGGRRGGVVVDLGGSNRESRTLDGILARVIATHGYPSLFLLPSSPISPFQPTLSHVHPIHLNAYSAIPHLVKQ